MNEEFKFKKQFGQNFLTDKNLLESIVKDSQIDKNTCVVEIGAGKGALTLILCKYAKKVVSFEIDKDLKDFLETEFKDMQNLNFVFKDALKESDEVINELAGEDFFLVANIPYYITSPLIFKFLNNPHCKSLTVMIQKEVAERIIAKPSTKDFGILSVKIGAQANVKICRIVSRNMFHPIPNVDSAVVSIVKKDNNINLKIFNELVDKSFAMRRKTLQNNLTNNYLSKEEFFKICEELKISPNIRAEALKIEDFINLSQSIEKIRQ